MSLLRCCWRDDMLFSISSSYDERTGEIVSGQKIEADIGVPPHLKTSVGEPHPRRGQAGSQLDIHRLEQIDAGQVGRIALGPQSGAEAVPELNGRSCPPFMNKDNHRTGLRGLLDPRMIIRQVPNLPSLQYTV